VNARFAACAVVLAGAGIVSAQEVQPRMGDPLPGLTAIERAQFDEGRVEFMRTLTVAEGQGPILNDTSCSTCHGIPRVGGAGSKRVIRFGKAASGGNPFDPLASLGGSLLQASSTLIECQEVVPPRSDVLARRVTPNVSGDGLIEVIRGADIRAREFTPPAGISGRAHMVGSFEDPPLARPRVGRFGWKAQLASLLSFSADASLNEMGFTNRFLTQENAPNGNIALLALCDTVPDPEDHAGPGGLHAIDRQTNFQRLTAPPPQTPRMGMTGAVVFNTIGCESCHRATFVTGRSAIGALSNKTIRPYSDFLLHDMGTSLGDGIVQGYATETELKTPPLWGLRSRADIGLLHDGRATGGTPQQNLRDAILAHDGEGQASRDAFVALTPEQQDQLFAFLMSLGRVEFDEEGDHDVDALDWFFLESDSRFTGPGAFFTPDHPGAVADFDRDGDFDLADFAVYQRAMTGDDVALADGEGFIDLGRRDR
jgi:di-heme oxidoreductase (putative peroxidase)